MYCKFFFILFLLFFLSCSSIEINVKNSINSNEKQQNNIQKNNENYQNNFDTNNNNDDENNSNSYDKEFVVKIEDEVFEKVIRYEINKHKGLIYNTDLMKIEELSKYLNYYSNSKKHIKSLKGIEYCVNLKYLYLENVDLIDISLLENLKSLVFLNVSHNNITDITALSNLNKLKFLYLNDNAINDISPLIDMINLEYVYLNNNNIVDISHIKNLTKIEELTIYGNYITDYSPLNDLNRQLGRYSSEVDIDIIKMKDIDYNVKRTANDINLSDYKNNVDKYINDVVNELIKEKDDVIDIMKAIYSWICLKIDYNINVMDIFNPALNINHAIRTGKTVCSGYTRLFFHMCELAGIKTLMLAGAAKTNNGNGSHAWNAVNVNNEWYIIDVTWGDLNNNVDVLTYDYFLVEPEISIKRRIPYFNFKKQVELAESIDIIKNYNEYRIFISLGSLTVYQFITEPVLID